MVAVFWYVYVSESEWVCVGPGSGTLCVVPPGFFFFFFLSLTHSGGHVAVDFKEAQTERGEGEVEGGSRANPDLLSGHQGRNKASAAMQIPQVHRPINAAATAPRSRI